MKIYILTSDKNIHIVEGLQYCVNKYWKPKPSVVLLGYEEPSFDLDDNFEFVSLGEDRGAGYIGDDLIKFFNSIEDKHFIFSVDDFFPIRQIDTNLLETLTDKMIKEDISRIALTDQVSDKPHSIIEDTDYKIIEMGEEANYRKSAVWSMWSKSYFLTYMWENMNLWEWELDERCKNDKHRIVGTNGKYVLQSCHLYKKGNLKSDWWKDSESSDTMVAEDQIVITDIIHR